MSLVIAVTAADKTMFHVAARVWGNATAAIRIAQATGITDPWLVGQQTLTIPDVPGPDTGGLPAPGTVV